MTNEHITCVSPEDAPWCPTYNILKCHKHWLRSLPHKHIPGRKCPIRIRTRRQ
jgi:hypothetical protein